MNILLLSTAVVLILFQTMTKKSYSEKVNGGAYSFTALCSLFAMIVFIISSGGEFNFSSDFLPYAIAFAACYSLASIYTLKALFTGPVSVASLLLSYSTMIPAIYSIIAYDEPIDIKLIAGTVLMIFSLFFANMEKKGEQKKITVKWLIYITVAAVTNGGCSLIQKIQQMNVTKGGYDCKNEFMIAALFIIVAVMAIGAILTEKKRLGFNLRKGCFLGSLCGIANGVVNYLVIVLSDPKMNMPASVMFPVISAGGIVLTAIVSVLLYKEKLSRMQITGFVLGTFSVIVLNL